MRILVDYRAALRGRTGVGEYIRGLVHAYTAAYDDDVELFSSSWKDRPAAAVAGELRARVIDRRVPVRVLNLLWHRAGWPPIEWLSGSAPDVVHSAHPLLIPARRAAQVVTVHDLFFMSHPEQTAGEIRRDYPALAPAHALRAHAIVTPSEYTAQLVHTQFGVPRARIHVCSPGAPRWRTLGRGPHRPADGCILFVGTLEPRKNVGALLDAYAMLVGRRPGAPRLVLAGRATESAAPWLERLDRPPLRGRAIHLGYVPNEEREQLYAGARVLVLPSLDEGFGLPVLDAMSAGIPVVVSRRGSLPEVAGDAGVLIDPDDPDTMASALDRVLADDEWAAALARSGLERARRYTWEASAERLRRAYLGAVARRGE